MIRQRHHPIDVTVSFPYKVLSSGIDTDKTYRSSKIGNIGSFKNSTLLGIALLFIGWKVYLTFFIDKISNSNFYDICNQRGYNRVCHGNKVSKNGQDRSVYNNVNPVTMLTNSDANQRCTSAGIKVSIVPSTANESYPFIIPDHFGKNIKYVKEYNGLWGMYWICSRYFYSMLCKGLPIPTLDRSTNIDNTMYIISFSCNDLFKTYAYGTGNYMMAIYSLRRMAQMIGNVDISITCTDAEETKEKLILPWLMGNFPRTYWYDQNGINDNKQVDTVTSLCGNALIPQLLPKTCRNYNPVHMYEDIIFELRRMAIALIGTNTLKSTHPATVWTEQNLWESNNNIISQYKNNQMQLSTPQRHDKPLLSNIDIDDVAFHIRCGDIMMSQHPNFGFLKFQSYNKHLQSTKFHNQFRSIGIITQPFSGQGRLRDRKGDDRCRKVIYAFQKYLDNQNYTYHTYNSDGTINELKVQVVIRNSPDEYLTTAYARLIMASQLVVIGSSSFSAFPAMASFAKEVYMQWDMLDPVLAKRIPTVQQMKEPFLTSADNQKLWSKDNGDTVIQWMMS
jgi:hypothetical protein